MEFTHEEELICLREDLLHFTRGGKIRESRKGLCANFKLFDLLSREQKLDCFESWPLFSGDNEFPVPLTEIDRFDTAYHQYLHGDKYQGRQLELRKDLAKHIADYIDKELLQHG